MPNRIGTSRAQRLSSTAVYPSRRRANPFTNPRLLPAARGIHCYRLAAVNDSISTLGLVAISILAVFLAYPVHCALDRICVGHARKFCKRHGLEISRVRWQMEFERRSDGRRGVKTEFTLVQLDCLDVQKQRRLVLLRVWPLGIRKLMSDEKYPESYDEQWPQTSG